MDLTMGIASMSMTMQQVSLQNAVSIDVMSKAMGTQEVQADSLIEDFTQSNPTVPLGSVGHNFDVRA